jgi:hypothetical protein
MSGLQTIAEELGALSETLQEAHRGRDEAEIDIALTGMERRMFSLLESAADQERITEIEKKARAELGKRRDMNAEQLRESERRGSSSDCLSLRFATPQFVLRGFR